MSDGDALLASILATPDDDAPRLVYADYLDEQGESDHAEFIRLQIEYENMKHEPPCRGDIHAAGGFGIRCSCRRGRVRERFLDLLERPHPIQSNAFAWCQPIRNTGLLIGRPWPENMTYRRGFVERISMRSSYLEQLDAIRAKQPIREVHLKDWPQVHSSVSGVYSHGIHKMFTSAEIKAAYKPEDGRHNLTLPLLRLEWPGIEFTVADRSTIGHGISVVGGASGHGISAISNGTYGHGIMVTSRADLDPRENLR